MGLLEDISNMKNQGFSENEIITGLREKGVSPKDVQEAISQLKIKNAVSEYEPGEERNVFAEQGGGWVQKTQEVPEQEAYAPQPAQSYNPPQQDYYSQEGGAPQGYSSGMDANTLIEISEQVFSEKIKPVQKEMDALNEFKSMNQIRIDNLNERLKRMEMVFDKLQITILEKIGSYGQNLEVVRKEMDMMQDSFSKVVDPLLDKSEKKHEEKIEKIRAEKKHSKKK